MRTLEKGIQLLEQIIAKNEDGILGGMEVFELYDTFGFPADLTALIASEHGKRIDQNEFEKQLQKQKERSRAATKIETEDWVVLSDGETQFVGYDALECETRILRYRKVKSNSGTVTSINGFSNIENLEGGTQSDRFELIGGTLSGTIDGQNGEDTFAGDDVNNTFTVNGSNSGTATGINGFSNIENLEGGTQSDRFELNAGTLSGTIDGQGGDDTFAGDGADNTFTIVNCLNPS